jgi:hypothetical protein
MLKEYLGIKIVSHPSCQTSTDNVSFTSPGDYTKCTSCSPISQRYFTGPDYTKDYCNPSNQLFILVEYLDFAQLSLSSESFIEIPAKHTDEYTIGFWLLAKRESGSSGAFRVRLDNIMTVYVTECVSRCFINLDNTVMYQQMNENDLNSFEVNNNYSMVKIIAASGFNNIWIYHRCTYSTKAKYFSLMYEHKTKIIQTSDSINNNYYDNYPIDAVFPYYHYSDTFSILINAYKDYSTEKSFVYLKNLAIFSEVISPYSDLHF